jgi:hypothetical protein
MNHRSVDIIVLPNETTRGKGLQRKHPSGWKVQVVPRMEAHYLSLVMLKRKAQNKLHGSSRAETSLPLPQPSVLTKKDYKCCLEP